MSPERAGESRRAGPAVVKEKILELAHTNSVSMPSAVFLDAGTDSVLRVARAGSVKLRLELLGLRADGACSGCGCWDEAGSVIMGALYGHSYPGEVGGRRFPGEDSGRRL